MRFSIALLAFATGGCWTPGPGQVDPTRYPWDQRMLAPPAPPRPQAEYCIISIETGNAAGIATGGDAQSDKACNPPLLGNPRP